MTVFPTYDLFLADGIHIALSSADECAANILELFSSATGLQLGNGSGHRITITKDENSLMIETGDGTQFRIMPINDKVAYPRYFWGLSHVIVQQTYNGILLHGALVEHHNRGIIMIAKSGTGKTTACKRLPPPWRTLSDDLVLVLGDKQGGYYAYPWPTWSRFLRGGKGGNWDVQKGVPLHAIFHLSQSNQDRVVPVGLGESIILLSQSAEQAFSAVRSDLENGLARRIRLHKLELSCILARGVPVFRLYLSLTGSFWHDMENVLGSRKDMVHGW